MGIQNIGIVELCSAGILRMHLSAVVWVIPSLRFRPKWFSFSFKVFFCANSAANFMYLARNGSHLLNKSSLLSCAPEYASLSKSRKKKKVLHRQVEPILQIPRSRRKDLCSIARTFVLILQYVFRFSDINGLGSFSASLWLLEGLSSSRSDTLSQTLPNLERTMAPSHYRVSPVLPLGHIFTSYSLNLH